MKVISYGNYANIHKRDNIRLLRDLAIKGVILLREEQLSVKDTQTFEMLMMKYYEYSLKFCLNQRDQNALDKRFNEVFADYKIEDG